jgi:hypothetical protein
MDEDEWSLSNQITAVALKRIAEAGRHDAANATLIYRFKRQLSF